jgi:hypothetical protein
MGYGAGIISLPADRRSLGKISLEKGLMSVFAGLDVKSRRSTDADFVRRLSCPNWRHHARITPRPLEVNPAAYAYWRASGEQMLKANSRAEDIKTVA